MNPKVLHSAIIRLSSNGIPLPYEERKIAFCNSLPANLHKAIEEFENVKDLIAKQGKVVRNTLSPSEKAIDTLLTKRVVEHFLNVWKELDLTTPPASEPITVSRPAPVVVAPSALSLKAKAMNMQLQLLELDGIKNEIPKTGANGTLFYQFKHRGPEAIRHLIKVKEGECVAALYHPQIGDIDIFWGDSRKGLKHIIEKHGEDFKKLGYLIEEVIPATIEFGNLRIEQKNHQGITYILESADIRAIIGTAMDGERKIYVLTSYILKESKGNNKTVLGAILTGEPVSHPAFNSSIGKYSLSRANYQTLGYLGKLMVQKFSTIQEVDRKQINVRPDWFQGRQTAYSQESFDKIVREGFDKSQEPIAVWLDPTTNTYIVISGHSRWHASEELFRRGQKDLKTMSVKIFQGSKEEAQDYAILESNRSGTAEGLLSDLKAYKRAVSKDYTIDKLKDLFKPEAHLRLLKDLSYLKETGKFIENLASDAAKSFPYLQRNAQWVGIIRKIYPNLTNFHEGELFDFFYAANKKSLNLNKEQFFNQIELRLNRLDFDPTKPLNMRNIISHAVVTAPGREYLKELETELRTATDERNKLELLIARAKQENAARLIPDFEARLSATNKTILQLIERKDKTERELKALERNTQDDLFSSLIQRSEPTLEEIRIQKFALKTKALKMKLALLEM